MLLFNSYTLFHYHVIISTFFLVLTLFHAWGLLGGSVCSIEPPVYISTFFWMLHYLLSQDTLSLSRSLPRASANLSILKILCDISYTLSPYMITKLNSFTAITDNFANALQMSSQRLESERERESYKEESSCKKKTGDTIFHLCPTLTLSNCSSLSLLHGTVESQ